MWPWKPTPSFSLMSQHVPASRFRRTGRRAFFPKQAPGFPALKPLQKGLKETMKIGLGLYRHMLSRDYYDFARQAGCTHVVVHLVDYFKQGATNPRHNHPPAASMSRGASPAIPKNFGQLPN